MKITIKYKIVGTWAVVV